MTELIKINETEGKKTVSARELHQKLEVKSQYRDWFKRMVDYGFEENKDYTTIAQKKATAQGNESVYKEHFISIDMAKEICMIQRSEIGKKFRQYFIECEKQMKNVFTNVQYITHKTDKEIDLERARFIYDVGMDSPVQKYKDICAALSVNMVAGENYLPLPKVEKQTYTASQVAEKFGITKQKVGLLANKNNLKTSEYGEKIWDRATNGKMVENFVYYQEGVDKIKELLNA